MTISIQFQQSKLTEFQFEVIIMLIVFQEEFNNVPFGYLDNRIYNRVRNEFLKLLKNEVVVDALLATYWHYTLRELSCNCMVNVMGCFILM